VSDVVEDLRRPSALLGPFILLLLGERSGHGYELMERLKDLGFSESSTSPVYRELRRLEDAGLICPSWEPPQARGPARKVYALTPSGLKALSSCAESAYELARTLESYRSRVRVVVRKRVRSAPRVTGVRTAD
jgi:PadR family transcriptional regulator PadR